ncbi:hypothetical protein [Streptomyces sp. NPDC007205]|uniref:hypothetical protein n=1 Tax=Streptomyces sp. NPDC007205 TaxID=3154316 RepID=UPI0033E27CEA
MPSAPLAQRRGVLPYADSFQAGKLVYGHELTVPAGKDRPPSSPSTIVLGEVAHRRGRRAYGGAPGMK